MLRMIVLVIRRILLTTARSLLDRLAHVLLALCTAAARPRRRTLACGAAAAAAARATTSRRKLMDLGAHAAHLWGPAASQPLASQPMQREASSPPRHQRVRLPRRGTAALVASSTLLTWTWPPEPLSGGGLSASSGPVQDTHHCRRLPARAEVACAGAPWSEKPSAYWKRRSPRPAPSKRAPSATRAHRIGAAAIIRCRRGKVEAHRDPTLFVCIVRLVRIAMGTCSRGAQPVTLVGETAAWRSAARGSLSVFVDVGGHQSPSGRRGTCV